MAVSSAIMKVIFKSAILLIIVSVFIIKTDAFYDLAQIGINRILDAAKKRELQQQLPPSNKDESIQYFLYTPSNKNEACLIQPDLKQLDRCAFNPNYETKFMIHGFAIYLTPTNWFNVLKDALLEHGDYNIIIVNWTLYNTLPFSFAYNNAELVGKKVGEMMKFLESYAKVPLETIHCIGHSLGSHVCGAAGRSVHTLGRITGLDPEGMSLYQSLTPNIRLNYTDADFVDVIHSSDIYSSIGLGIRDPFGHIDFYLNDGVDQIECVYGNTYKMFTGQVLTVNTFADKKFCNHLICFDYITNSLKDNCKLVATECQTYLDFKEGRCSSNTQAEMGLFIKKIPGIPPKTKFYINTIDIPHSCKPKDNHKLSDEF